MGPGVPGVGIAGLLYVIAAILAPAREIYLTARGRSSRARWAMVMRQFLLAWSIVGAVVAFYIGLIWMAGRGWLGEWGDRGLHLFGIPNVAVGPLLLAAALVLTGVYALMIRTRAVEDPEVIAFDHRHSIVRGRTGRTLVSVPGSGGAIGNFPVSRTVHANRAAVVFNELHGIVVYPEAG